MAPFCKFLALYIDMIARAGRGVAMRNALRRVKEAADYVTENANDGDGVVEVIERFIPCPS